LEYIFDLFYKLYVKIVCTLDSIIRSSKNESFGWSYLRRDPYSRSKLNTLEGFFTNFRL